MVLVILLKIIKDLKLNKYLMSYIYMVENGAMTGNCPYNYVVVFKFKKGHP